MHLVYSVVCWLSHYFFLYETLVRVSIILMTIPRGIYIWTPFSGTLQINNTVVISYVLGQHYCYCYILKKNILCF